MRPPDPPAPLTNDDDESIARRFDEMNDTGEVSLAGHIDSLRAEHPSAQAVRAEQSHEFKKRPKLAQQPHTTSTAPSGRPR